MLSKKDNQLLTQTGPGTPMGDMFRRYWIPALMSEEIPVNDGMPVSVQILGERFVAFRDTNGRVGMLDEYCPHRGCSLTYARNEECGLRCIYHGWKFDADGQCVDIPSEPEESTYKHKVKARAVPVNEAGGMIWAYLGPQDKIPVFPDFLWTKVPGSHLIVKKVLQECNYLQAVEGGIDSSHVGFLHSSFLDEASPWGIAKSAELSRDNAPALEVEFTNYGYRYCAVRNLGGSKQMIRITPFIMPWYTFVPMPTGEDMFFHAWVPRDDYSNWAYDIHFNAEHPINEDYLVSKRGVIIDSDYRKLANPTNKHKQDHEAMQTKNFSGIYGIMVQDQAVQESMGPIYDRSREHLATSDIAIIEMRRLLLKSLKEFKAGKLPIGLEDDVPFDKIQADSRIVEKTGKWHEMIPLDPDFQLEKNRKAKVKIKINN